MKWFQFIAAFLLMTLTLQAGPEKLDPLTTKIKKFEIKELALPEAVVALNKQIMAEYPDHKHLLVGFVDSLRSGENAADLDLEKALGEGAAVLGEGNSKPRKLSLSINSPEPIEVMVGYLCKGYMVHYGKYDQTLVIYGWHRGELGKPEE